MKYIDLLVMLDLLAKYHPRYHSHEVIGLAEDILKWLNNELPEDCSTLIYLKGAFGSPAEAVRKIWNDLHCLAGPFSFLN